MKRLTLCVVVFFLFVYPVQAVEIPGGVVFSEGGKAIFYDFETKSKTSLLEDSSSPIEKAVISPRGKILVWTNNGRFYRRSMPKGEIVVFPEYWFYCEYDDKAPYLYPITKTNYELLRAVVPPKYKKLPEEQQKSIIFRNLQPVSASNARSLSISDAEDNEFLTYEMEEYGERYTLLLKRAEERLKKIGNSWQIGPNWEFRHPVYELKTMNGMLVQQAWFYFPVYQVEKKPFLTLNFLPVTKERTLGFTLYKECYAEENIPPLVKENLPPPASGYQIKEYNKLSGNVLFPAQQYYGPPEWMKARKEIRSALFPACSPNGLFFAFIYYQQSKGWGPIVCWQFQPGPVVVWQFDPKTRTNTPKTIPRLPGGPVVHRQYSEKELSVPITDCKGLAWKPDGSLTYLIGENIFSIEVMKQNAAPSLITSEVRATKFYWVTNDVFVFRHTSGALYIWRNGRGEKLLDSIPEEFSYCSVSPLKVGDASVAKKAQ